MARAAGTLIKRTVRRLAVAIRPEYPLWARHATGSARTDQRARLSPNARPITPLEDCH